MAADTIDALPLIVIVGPTASGKTEVAIKLAQALDGEIICADSRTIYKGMNIGTAKPTEDEQQRAPHWGIDLVEPTERFTVVDFKKYAETKIREIRNRKRIPILVGGTGLYIDAILFDYQFGIDTDLDLAKRNLLEKLSVSELHNYCIKNNIKLPLNIKNKRHLIRAIEQNGINNKRRNTPINNTIVVGISTKKEILNKRIERRAQRIFKEGVVEEAIALGKRYGWDSEALTGNIYQIVKLNVFGHLSRDELESRFVQLDRQLAKKQRTWFKRNKYITWLPRTKIEAYVSEQLAKLKKA